MSFVWLLAIVVYAEEVAVDGDSWLAMMRRMLSFHVFSTYDKRMVRQERLETAARDPVRPLEKRQRAQADLFGELIADSLDRANHAALLDAQRIDCASRGAVYDPKLDQCVYERASRKHHEL